MKTVVYAAAAQLPGNRTGSGRMWANARDQPFLWYVIRMYFDDHNPPHFHAAYAGNEAQVGIEPIAILDGALPNRAALHQLELIQN